MDAEAIVRQAEDAYNAQDIDRVKELFDPDVVVYWDGKKLVEGRDPLIEFEAQNFASWSDFKMTKTLWAASGDRIAVEWKCSYIEKDSGDFVEVYGAEFWTIRDNHRVEWRAYTQSYVNEHKDSE